MPSKLSLNPQPYLYEINTWPWLEAISRTEGRAIDLGTVPDRYWDEIADLGFDGVWLMGVWQRSPAGIGIALTMTTCGSASTRLFPIGNPTMLWDLPTAYAAMLSMIISVAEARSRALGRRLRGVVWA